MNIEEAIQDLKQYIDVSIGQRLDGLATKEDLAQVENELRSGINEVRSDVKELRIDMDAQFNTVLDAVGERLNNSDARVEDHEHRLQRLERHAA